jgi:hypothetical protein
MGGGERRGSRLLLPAVSATALLLCSPLGLPRQNYRITHPARCASERGGAGRIFWAGLECAPANCSAAAAVRGGAAAAAVVQQQVACPVADQTRHVTAHPGRGA